jgi:hypothetical protein
VLHPHPRAALLALGVLACAQAAGAAEEATPTFAITRAAGPIQVDGDLSDAGWSGALKVDTWYETNPGDNVPPSVRNVGYLTYDDRFFYAAFEFQDPEPGRIRAPLGDRDNVPSDTDYGGVILNPRHDKKTALLLLANPRGIQYDAVTDDASGEDSAPDFFWDSAARLTPQGWVLEMRIPFSSLRYPKADVQSWGILLYRNYPRAYRYQMFSSRLPRGSSCFICHSGSLTGLQGLPAGGALVVAPYVNASQTAAADGLGSPLENGRVRGDVGGDLKWTPGANTALDATVNPDFSQIESDEAQIGVNERFALFFPEKRPFFLEGVELFSTPLQAVYTRTITAPRWGVRGTGRLAGTTYTALLAEDGGGGSVILPGTEESDLADQEFRSTVGLARLRRDVGRSFVSLLLTDREVRGGGHNRVFGPDFQWRPGTADTVTGQLLWSRSLTPRRPDLAEEWTGARLSGHAADLWWQHSTKTVDWFGEYRDLADGFRADNGFVPQVGIRQAFGEAGYTFRPQGFLRRLRVFTFGERITDRGGLLLVRGVSVGTGMDGRFASFFRIRYANDRVRALGVVVPRQRVHYELRFTPTRAVSSIALLGFVGEEVDFANARTGRGANVTLQGTVRPTNHLELRLNAARRWLDVPPLPDAARRRRLFTAGVERVRATYTFTPRCFLRAVAQYVHNLQDPTLFTDEVDRKTGELGASLLFAYKLNWQTVLFVGYGDNRELLEDTDQLERADRQLFLKLSYAFQK